VWLFDLKKIKENGLSRYEIAENKLKKTKKWMQCQCWLKTASLIAFWAEIGASERSNNDHSERHNLTN
jgi:hypothetical protein